MRIKLLCVGLFLMLAVSSWAAMNDEDFLELCEDGTTEEVTIKHIYDFVDILHCELIAKVADEYIESCKLKTGNFDNIANCKYAVPSYWDIGRVYA